MTQLEIKFFYPLTEQISLDLDFKPCQDYQEEQRRKIFANSVVSTGQYLIAGNGITSAPTWETPTYKFQPAPDAVGCWCIGDDNGIQVWRNHRPNWLHQKMTKVFFGWKWKDK